MDQRGVRVALVIRVAEIDGWPREHGEQTIDPAVLGTMHVWHRADRVGSVTDNSMPICNAPVTAHVIRACVGCVRSDISRRLGCSAGFITEP